MNYDKIILELMTRIQSLEQVVSELLQKMSAIELNDEPREEGKRKFSRSYARHIAIEKIKELYPEYESEKALRIKGGGILVNKPGFPQKIIKFSHSRTFQHQEGWFEHGWHSVLIDEVLYGIYDLCLFSMYDSKGEWHFFLFKPDDISEYSKKNRSGGGNELHLYFSVQGGNAYELREKKVDVTEFYNNWDLI